MSSGPAHHTSPSPFKGLAKIVAAGAGVAVTPFPQMLTQPVCASVSIGQVTVSVGVAHALHVMTLVVKSGGIDGCVQVAWSPVQTSWIV